MKRETINDERQSLTLAIATTDGEAVPKGHFGQAPRFDLYRVNPGSAVLIQSVSNPNAGEAGDHRHGDGVQGQGHHGHGIGRLLGDHGAELMVARAFGANIKRMRRRFLPVVVHRARVSEALLLVQQHWEQVVEHWQQGEERKHLVLR